MGIGKLILVFIYLFIWYLVIADYRSANRDWPPTLLSVFWLILHFMAVVVLIGIGILSAIMTYWDTPIF